MKRLLSVILALLIVFVNLSADNLHPEFNKSSDDLEIEQFLENKGQMFDQNHQPRKDVRYIFEKDNFKLIMKENSFSYELSHIDMKLTPTSMIDYEGLPKYARYKPDIQIISHRVDVEFLDANPFPEIISYGASNDHFNFYNTVTPNDGAAQCRTYNRVVYKDIYPNIDLEFQAMGESIKYDIIVHAGGDLKQIRMKYHGADNIELKPDGRIRIETSEGYIEERIPASYTSDVGFTGDTEPVDIHYILQGNVISFDGFEYSEDSRLTIDPEVVWGSYFGDVDRDEINAIQHDNLNNVIASGSTVSRNNIATAGTYQTTYGGGMMDAFLVKFSHSGQRLWATYCGGDSLDVANGVAADNVWHHVYIMGHTASRNGLVSDSCYQQEYGQGYYDAFLAKFDQLGNRLWCTYYGGSDASMGIGGEYIYNAAIDERLHDIYFVGLASSDENIASEHAHQDFYSGEFDAMLVKFTPDGDRDWGTYIGGEGFDGAYGITLDPSGYITIGGYTESENSSDFLQEIIASEGAYQESLSGYSDAFIERFNLRGTRQWGTYYGGSDVEIVEATAADKDKNVYIMGSTSSDNGIATSGSHQETRGGSRDGFLGKFSPTGDRIWGTYYGGPRGDEIFAAYCDSEGNVTFTGKTYSKTGISTPGSYQEDYVGVDTTFTVTDPETGESSEVTITITDGFISTFQPDGSRLWGTYFGGRDEEIPTAVAYDKNDNLLIGGYASSTVSIGTPGTYGPTAFGDADAFLIKFGEFMRITDLSAPVCVGNPITIKFETGTTMSGGNVFTAQLSDDVGDFSSPVDIGNVTAIDDDEVECVIPMDTPPGSGYRIRLSSSNPAKISKDNGYDITVSPLPTPEIQGSNPVCSREHVTYTVESSTFHSNKWYVYNGEILSDTTLNYVRIAWMDVSSGQLKVVQTNNQTGCIDSAVIDVEVKISPTPNIIGEESVIANTVENYRTSSQSLWNFYWEVEGGTINSSNESTEIEVSWGGSGTGTVKVVATHKNTDCKDSLIMNIAINSVPIELNGNKTVCALSSEEYFISPDENMSYKWHAVGGEVQGVDTDSIATILWGEAGNGVIKLARTDISTQETDTASFNITIVELPTVRVFGNNEICESEYQFYYTDIEEDLTNEWIVYNGEIDGNMDGDSLFVNWAAIPDGNDSTVIKASVTLRRTSATTGCVNEKTLIISLGKRPDALITGSDVVCANDISYYFTESGEDVLANKWEVEGGNIISSDEGDTLQVNWGNEGDGKVTLIQTGASNCDNNNEMSISIVDNPPKPTITPDGLKLISSADFGNQWYVAGEMIEGAIDKEYTPDSSGLYSVKVLVSAGCESPISDPYNFVKISVEDLVNSDLKIYPNPTSDIVRIEFKNTIFDRTVSMRNALGVKVTEQNVLANTNFLDIDLSDFAGGAYMLSIETNGETRTYKIIKQ